MKTITVFVLTYIIAAFVSQPDFLAEQKKYERVRAAFQEKGKIVTQQLAESSLKPDDLNILIMAFKAEDKLELYAKKKVDESYKLLTTYDICARSGQLGPKRRQGDNQVPEGFYYIDRYNPISNFYLSLGLDYPNQSDRKKSKAANLGGDIFIHGSCVTIGCLPMTDDKIKEIYLYAIHARNNGQLKIPVYVFPFKMTDQNSTSYKLRYGNNTALIRFWENLKTGYDRFRRYKKELVVSVDANGDYRF